MGLAISPALVLSAVQAVIRYRGRVDEILALNEAAAGLPFRLPDPPLQKWPHEAAMVSFLSSEHGTTLLELHALTQEFKDILKQRADNVPKASVERQYNDCFRLYFEACEIDATVLLPGGSAAQQRKAASTGPSKEMRLAYYVVESDRLSRNPALARVALATADALLEVVGENASVFVANPKTRDLVQSLLDEFAIKNDFDDASAGDIFRQLVSATAIAVLDNPGVLPNKPALVALYGAVNDVRKKLRAQTGSDQQAQEALLRLIQPDGLKQIVNAYLARVAQDPALLTSNALVRDAISAVLLELGGNAAAIFEDEDARTRAIEALIAVGSDHVQGLLARQLGPGRPLSAAVLSAVARSLGESARGHGLAERLSRGKLLGDLYGVVLGAVAAAGSELQTEAHVSEFVAGVVTSLAGRLAEIPADNLRSRETVDALLGAALKVLQKRAAAWAGSSDITSAVLVAAISATADAAADGLTMEDAESIIDAALKAAGEHAHIAGFGDTQAAVIQSVTAVLASAELKELTEPSARKALLLSALEAINANPKVWGDRRARDTFQPLATAVIEVLRSGKRRELLGTAAMLEVADLVLAAASRQAGKLAEQGAAVVDDLKEILLRALDFVDAELGRGIVQREVPALLERVARKYLEDVFTIDAATQQQMDALIREVVKAIKEGT